MKIIYTDVLVIGGGGAGASAAIEAHAVTTRSSFPSFRRSAATPRPLRAVCRHRSAT